MSRTSKARSASPRRLTLADEGQRFHAEARTILRLVDEATDGARSAGGGLTGTVRVSCTAALGVRHVCRMLFAIQDQYPEIVVDLSLSDAVVKRDGDDAQPFQLSFQSRF